jgi:hypothetical protein
MRAGQRSYGWTMGHRRRLRARALELAARQHNRIPRHQLLELGVVGGAIDWWLASNALVAVEQGVFAFPPLLPDDQRGRWMGATLTAPDTKLSRTHAAVAWGLLSHPPPIVTVTRPGSGGPRRLGGVIVHRSTILEGDCTTNAGIPITSVPRTLLDLAAAKTSDRALARAVRESARLKHVTLGELGDALGRYRSRRGRRRLGLVVARFAGLPIARARSGAEVQALELLRDSGRPMPRLNHVIAREEADLSWSQWRLIIEIDGGPFHLDAGEDARKERAWTAAGWTVRRIPSDDVYDRPERLLAMAPPDPTFRPC